MAETKPDFIATSARVLDGNVELQLLDGSTHSFPIHYYPRLASASQQSLGNLSLRVGGRALRWPDIDEDIWIADAILQRYPAQPSRYVAESPSPYL